MDENKELETTYTKEDIVNVLQLVSWTDVFNDKEEKDFKDIVQMFYKIGLSHGSSKDITRMALHEIVNLGCDV